MSDEIQEHVRRCFLPTAEQDHFISDSKQPTPEADMITWDDIQRDPHCIKHFFYTSEDDKYEWKTVHN